MTALTRCFALSALLACAAASLGHAHADEGKHGPIVGHFGTHNVKPGFIAGAISSHYYPASDCPTVGVWCGDAGDDLLTGGLGATGLLLVAPAFANPLAPTPAELRRNAIHGNYRAVLDILPTGGYGTL